MRHVHAVLIKCMRHDHKFMSCFPTTVFIAQLKRILNCLPILLVYFQKNIPIGLQQRANDANTENNVMAAEAESPADMSLLSTLTLPSNATSIRADITDNFSCENKPYGYYADVENDCQIFHVCLPVTYADGKENTFRWSFICPEETVFSQVSIGWNLEEFIGFSHLKF